MAKMFETFHFTNRNQRTVVGMFHTCKMKQNDTSLYKTWRKNIKSWNFFTKWATKKNDHLLSNLHDRNSKPQLLFFLEMTLNSCWGLKKQDYCLPTQIVLQDITGYIHCQVNDGSTARSSSAIRSTQLLLESET